MAGVLYPKSGSLSKENGRRVARFGPIMAWRIADQDSAVQVRDNLHLDSAVSLSPVVSWHEATWSWSSTQLCPIVSAVLPDEDGSLLQQCLGSKGRCLNGCWLLQILLQTPLAEYTCVKAAAVYKQSFAHLTEQAEIAHEASRLLSDCLRSTIPKCLVSNTAITHVSTPGSLIPFLSVVSVLLRLKNNWGR